MRPVFILLLMFAAVSCASDDDNNCANALPPPNWFELGFVDQNDQPLIGTYFTRDSFKLQGAGTTLYLKPVPFGVEETLLVPFPEIRTGTTYSLELDEDNVERIRIDFETRELDCGFDYIISAFFYNDELFSDQNETVYLLPKQIDP